MQRQVPATRRFGARHPGILAGFFLTLLTALLVHAGDARAQASIPSSAAYKCDFENSYCDFYEQSKVASSGGRRSSMVGQAASGQVGVKLTTLPGDSGVNGSGTWERNDLAKQPDASYCNPGQEEWWAFSILFPGDFVFPPGPEAGIVMDFHHTGSSGQANFEIQTIPGLGLRARGYGGASVNSGKYEALIPDPHGAAAGTVARNVWYHFVLHVRWSPNGDGFMEGWVNGRKYQAYQGATLYAGQACYLKLANYHGAFGQSSSVVFDRVARGRSAADVSHLTLEGVGNAPSGSATPSLVPHFYRTILRREPDAGGRAFWEGELARMTGMGASASEVWFAMTSAFFASPEYAAFRRDDVGFVTDLYASFLNRAADAGGMAYWTGLLAQGMPREVLVTALMFSPEFTAMAGGGAKSARAEIDTVIDFYRGLLARLPDSAGFSYWLTQFRYAQCSGGDAVNAQADAISGAFANGPEGAGRGRTNAQFVADLYNAFLRRGGDLQGVRHWIDQLDRGVPRDVVRLAFRSSPEFQARVREVVLTGCAG